LLKKSQVSFNVPPKVNVRHYLPIGYAVFGQRAIRADLVERIDRHLYEIAKNGPYKPPQEISRWLGCSSKQLPSIIQAFGYQQRKDGLFQKRKKGKPNAKAIPQH